MTRAAACSVFCNAVISRDPSAVRTPSCSVQKYSCRLWLLGETFAGFRLPARSEQVGELPVVRTQAQGGVAFHPLSLAHSGCLPKTVVSARLLRTAWCFEAERGLRETCMAGSHQASSPLPAPSHGPHHYAVCLRDVMYFCCSRLRLQSSTPPPTASDSHRQPSSAVMTSSPRSCSPAALGGRIC